jgi:exopolysaccharide production protein ExoZ
MISILTKLNSIQILRGVAAMLVLQVHLFVFLNIFDEIHICGAIGVDIFFVLSGFLMLNSINRSQGIRKFISARFSRIFPALLIVTIIMSILEMAGVREFLFSITQFYIFRLEYKDPIVFSAWSLLFEIFFYSILSLSFIFGQKSMLLFILIIGLIGLFIESNNPFLSFLFSNMLWNL